MSTNDTSIHQKNLTQDQERLKAFYSGFYKTRGKQMASAVAKKLRATPEGKKQNIKNVLLYGAGGATGGAIVGRSPVAAGAGALIGGVGGHLRQRQKVHKAAKTMLQNKIMKDMSQESKKNVLVHTILAQPGTQKLEVKRPWGVEKYEG